MESENDVMLSRARFLARRSNGYEYESITLLMLIDMQIPLNSVGFDYLSVFISSAFQKRGPIVLKELYEDVRACYDKGASIEAMDSAMRDAVEKGWKHKTNGKWAFYIPYEILIHEEPPSNLRFISAMVYFLRMWQGCCKRKERDCARK